MFSYYANWAGWKSKVGRKEYDDERGNKGR